jgi:hypothetical protein
MYSIFVCIEPRPRLAKLYTFVLLATPSKNMIFGMMNTLISLEIGKEPARDSTGPITVFR